MTSRRQFTQFSTLALLGGAAALRPAWGQKLASTRVVVGFAPGGTTDLVARRVAEKMGGATGFADTAIVDNRSGAGGQIACQAVKAAAPDGATLLCTPYSCMVIYPHVYKKLAYQPVSDFEPISIAATTTQAMAVGPLVPESVKTVKDYLAWVKANPRHSGYGSPAAGSTSHFLGALLGLESGLPLVQVPYRGAVPGIADLIAGQIPVMFTTTGDLLPQLRAGKLRLLATSGRERSPFAPQVPTFVEQGLTSLYSEEWFGFYAPANTSPGVIKAAGAAIHAALQDRAVVESLAGMGLVPTPSTPQAMLESQKAESERWGKLVARIGFTAES
ncbi:MAG: Bug family tripartite tricarboxylate transporter substrate binding protein [Acidovorax sp.]|nr:Bug family tripartite tricarboxylate transporter substrate binding protein [Acidovorax sp.]